MVSPHDGMPHLLYIRFFIPDPGVVEKKNEKRTKKKTHLERTKESATRFPRLRVKPLQLGQIFSFQRHVFVLLELAIVQPVCAFLDEVILLSRSRGGRRVT